ncbi:MAG: UDP-N-acetylglucosamine 2-epimerase (non-hydrolyzing) [Pyrinomonadaceae bacterium]|nr:UDP-N-acetylglucosamine 2-epimerase (non-hydrolyzing) [Pyrinomonadaceae bacterium]
MKVLTVVGARPQFIKAAPVSRALRAMGSREVLVHTGQHYDREMSEIFFEEMGIREPDINLEVGSGSHGWQTGQIMVRLEKVLRAEKPDWVLVYGDTNSTLAGALVAAKLLMRVAHVEAGLRSFNRAMPEEINRIVADHLSSLLLCPSRVAVNNLAAEGITEGVHQVGDVMYDALLEFREVALRRSTILQKIEVEPKEYLLLTVHRAENTCDPERLKKILAALAESSCPVIFPVHPRTMKALLSAGFIERSNQSEEGVTGARLVLDNLSLNHIRLIEPVGYLDMLMLAQHARMILTDSGGLQKEAYWLSVPCVTLREETEWVETVEAGWNILTGTDTERILDALRSFKAPAGEDGARNLYGEPQAAERCVKLLGDLMR